MGRHTVKTLAWITSEQASSARDYAHLRDRRREYDNLVELTDSLHELIDTRALDDIYIVIVPFDLNRYCEICLVKNLDCVSRNPRQRTTSPTNLE